MPQGVEHLITRYIKQKSNGLIPPLMPQGVEHRHYGKHVGEVTFGFHLGCRKALSTGGGEGGNGRG